MNCNAKVMASAVIVLLYGCGSPAEIEESVNYWHMELDPFIEQGASLDELHAWLRAHDVYYSFENTDIVNGTWQVGLEKIHMDTFRCEWIDIVLEVKISDGNRLISYEIKREGPCLW